MSNMVLSTEELDELDLRLLDALQRNARSTFTELGSARRPQGARPSTTGSSGSSSAATSAAIRAQLDAKRLGLHLIAFVSCYTSPDCAYDEFTRRLSEMPEICEVHSVAGEETLRLQSRDALDAAPRRPARAAQSDARNGAHAHDDRAQHAVRSRRRDGAAGNERAVATRAAIRWARIACSSRPAPCRKTRGASTTRRSRAENEILCEVDALNIDSASFRQLAETLRLRRRSESASASLEIVRERGKQHNPVTGSGGMFVGRVLEIGDGAARRSRSAARATASHRSFR